MLISIFAWVFRFGLFAVGDPGAGLWMLILSMIMYGMAFDFFNISGSLFVDREAEGHDPRERAGTLHDHDERSSAPSSAAWRRASSWTISRSTA